MAAFRVGTDCAGMEAPIQALDNLEVKYKHAFSCDVDVHVRETIMANYPPEVFYDDVMTRDNKKAVPTDLYVAGFPCQPFSGAGIQQGFDDKQGRGVIFFYVKDYIVKQQPKVFVLENVVNLVRLQGGKYFKAIRQELESLGNYNVSWQILSTEEHGIPHNRKRVYMVGIRRDVDDGSFKFPEPITCPPIEVLLDTRNPKLAATGRPPATATTATRNVKMFLKRLEAKGAKPLLKAHIIDVDSSTYRSKCWLERTPCITCNRSKGHWVTSRGRRFLKTEMLRLNGMNPKKFKVAIPETALGKQIGNTMSVNVLERIFCRLLPAAGLTARKARLPDRWANGTALTELMETRDCRLTKVGKSEVAVQKMPLAGAAKKTSAVKKKNIAKAAKHALASSTRKRSRSKSDSDSDWLPKGQKMPRLL